MTQDEIIEMAEKVGFYGHSKNFFDCTRSQIEAFAKLVAAKEREACAKVCEKHAEVYGAFEQTPELQTAWAACIDSRDAIRARGEA
jgi:hypothetical protein